MPILSPAKLYKDLDLTFSAHPETQDVLKKVDLNAVRQSLKTLLFTVPGERLFQPEVGSGITALLFEPIDPITTEVLRQSIANTLTRLEPRLQLDNVDVIPNEDDNEYEITLFFTIVGISQPASLTVTLERLR